MIRLGAPADLPTAAGVYRRASLSNAGDRASLLAHPEHLILGPKGLAEGRTYVAEEHGLVVGFATWAEACGAIELEDLFVDPGWRRCGIAVALVSRIVDVLRARGVEWLEVTANPHAREFLPRRRVHRLRRGRDGLRRRAPDAAGDPLTANPGFTCQRHYAGDQRPHRPSGSA
jgi:GNAT superfamily N-acetyltransferase